MKEIKGKSGLRAYQKEVNGEKELVICMGENKEAVGSGINGTIVRMAILQFFNGQPFSERNLKNLRDAMNDSESFMLDAVMEDGRNLMYGTARIKAMPKIVLEAEAEFEGAIEFAAPHLQTEKMKAAAKKIREERKAASREATREQ